MGYGIIVGYMVAEPRISSVGDRGGGDEVAYIAGLMKRLGVAPCICIRRSICARGIASM